MQVDFIASEERGNTLTDWLNSRHTYSFGQYHNLKRLNFGTLRVFNDDVIQPGKGFGAHPHENMEIITIVLDGALEHKDSKGNQGVLVPGDVQRMTAGTGIEHSEYNASKDAPLHLLQIWIYPNQRGLTPGYEQKKFTPENFHNNLKQVVSSKPSEESLFIHQDASFYLGHFDAGQTIAHTLANRKHGDYIFLIDGQVALGDKMLKKGDSVQVTQVDKVEMRTLAETKILVVEVFVKAALY